MISIHDYTITIVTENPMTRTILPQILALLGQDRASFFTTVRDALKDLQKSTQSKLLFVDGEKHLEDIGTYRDRLYNAFVIFILDAVPTDTSASPISYSADECLVLLNELEGYVRASVEEKNAYFLKHEGTKNTMNDILYTTKDEYLYQSFELPVESVEIYKILSPLTVQSVTSALRAILPEQTVKTADVHLVHYKLLERPKEKRIQEYRPDVL